MVNENNQYIVIDTKITIRDMEINLEFPEVRLTPGGFINKFYKITKLSDKLYSYTDGKSDGYIINHFLTDDDIVEVSKHLKIPYIEDTLKMNRSYIDDCEEYSNVVAFGYFSNIVSGKEIQYPRISLSNDKDIVVIGKIDDIFKVRTQSTSGYYHSYGYAYSYMTFDKDNKELIKKRNKLLELIIKDSQNYING